jgi:hypothetical protein
MAALIEVGEQAAAETNAGGSVSSLWWKLAGEVKLRGETLWSVLAQGKRFDLCRQG